MAAAMFASAAFAQNLVTIPPHSSIYNGYTRGYTFTAQTTFLIQQLEVPMDAYQAGDTAAVLIRKNGAVAFRSAGNTNPVIQVGMLIAPGDVVDVMGNWSPAVPGSFTAHNSYTASMTNYATTIEGVPHTLQRNGWQWDISDPNYTSGAFLAPTTGSMGRVLMYTSPATGIFANFTASATTGALPFNVNFTDTTYTSDPGGVLSWAWDLDGDNVVDSTLQNPSFVYPTCGDYTVTLTVTDATHGSNTLTRTGYIHAGDGTTPTFTWSMIAPNVLQFTDTTTPAATTWAWDLDGDGITDSTAQNPVWVYSQACVGVAVRLSVTRDCRGPFTATNSLAIAPNSMATTSAGGNGTSSTTYIGNIFDIQVTNPQGINVCALSVRPYTFTGPFTVSLYATPDTYVGKNTTPGAWRLLGTGSGTSVGGTTTTSVLTVVPLTGFAYLPQGNYGLAVLLSGPAATKYICYSNGPLGPFSNSDLVLFPNPATAPGMSQANLFTSAGINSRVWNGAIHYSTATSGGDAGYGFFGAGCASSLGITSLSASNRPQLGTNLTVNLNNLPMSAAIMMTGFSKTGSVFGPLPLDMAAFGAPGCFARVSSDANLFLIGAANAATWTFGVPNDPSMTGLVLYNQALVLDPAANALGAVASDATGMMIGL